MSRYKLNEDFSRNQLGEPGELTEVMLHGACFENGCHLKEEEEKPPAKKVKIDATANGHHDTDVDGQESAKEMIRNRKRVVA